GAALLGLAGFQAAVWGMAAVLALILLAIALFLPAGLPKGRKDSKFSAIWSRDPQVNRLSLARMFLFGARDVWFVVGIPVYFQSVLSDGTPDGRRAAFFLIGTFMAVWIIAYGAVQASAPRLLGARDKTRDAIVDKAIAWAGRLVPIPFVLAALAWVAGAPAIWLSLALVAGLMLFGFVFAINSAVHSYLILAFSKDDRVTMDVGFYYMANAAGRLLGTLLSGLSFQFGGLPLCLATAGAMALASWFSIRRLRGERWNTHTRDLR
ncbi:MAG: MFS transporter, partial [Paracoccus sp. (in: a-proteobacteria)]|nr:MFS transporter [Paracoccus sp. (in: a-proteobacteria)]